MTSLLICRILLWLTLRSFMLCASKLNVEWKRSLRCPMKVPHRRRSHYNYIAVTLWNYWDWWVLSTLNIFISVLLAFCYSELTLQMKKTLVFIQPDRSGLKWKWIDSGPWNHYCTFGRMSRYTLNHSAMNILKFNKKICIRMTSEWHILLRIRMHIVNCTL